MKAVIDRAGRILLPKKIRQRFCRPGAKIELVEHPDGVLLRAVSAQQLSLIHVDGLLVHTGRAKDGTDWDLSLKRVREERLRRSNG